MATSKAPAVVKSKVPTLQELHHDPKEAFKNDELKSILNVPPPEKWLEQQQYGNGRYLPIDKVEFMLDRIFQEWRIEVLREGVMFQSIYVTVRVHYKNPLNGEWCFHDGVGAKSVQTDKGFSAADLSHIKDAAVQMALPSAKSYAIKDACDHIGRIFGRDVNRKNVVDFKGAYATEEPPVDKAEERLIKLINEAKTVVDLEKLKEHLASPSTRMAYDKKFKDLKS